MKIINKIRTVALAGAMLCLLSAQAAKIDSLAIATKNLPTGKGLVTVITPESTDANAKYPTVYLLNGYTGNHKSWLYTQPQLPELADKYGMVIVLPNGMDSWYWDSPVDKSMKMETYFIDELVPYIDANYPTIPQKDKRAISGLSMGGHGAMWLAMRHTDVFGNAGSMSGGVDIRPFPKNWKMAQWLGPEESNQNVWDEHTVINLVPSLGPDDLNIIFDCGTDDFFYEVNCNLHTALLAAKIPHDFISRPGNHSHPYWRNSILYHLLFFNQAFNQ